MRPLVIGPKWHTFCKGRPTKLSYTHSDPGSIYLTDILSSVSSYKLMLWSVTGGFNYKVLLPASHVLILNMGGFRSLFLQMLPRLNSYLRISFFAAYSAFASSLANILTPEVLFSFELFKPLFSEGSEPVCVGSESFVNLYGFAI